MNESKAETGGRRGGREARRAIRAAPLARNQRPVWPGPGRRALQAALRR